LLLPILPNWITTLTHLAYNLTKYGWPLTGYCHIPLTHYIHLCVMLAYVASVRVVWYCEY